MPLTPFPGIAIKSSRTGSSIVFVSFTKAAAKGCSDACSKAAAIIRFSFSGPWKQAILSNCGTPLVKVPVLSKTIVFSSLILCSASPLRIKIPFLAPNPLPTIKAVGVAKPSAQGQAITKVAIEAINAAAKPLTGTCNGITLIITEAISCIGSGKSSQTAKTITAKHSTTGTKTAVILSASNCIGTLECCASLTICITCAKKVSFPTFVACTSK